MAKVILDQLYKRVSGRIDSSTAVNTFNGGQSLLRGFTNPRNPQTDDQQAIRNIFSFLTKEWGQTLSDSDRAGWVAFAAANPVTNNLGTRVTRTGLSAFVELNTLQYIRSASYISTAPVLPRPSPASAIVDLDPTGGAVITITHGYSVLTGLYVMFSLTPILTSPAITPKPSTYRLIEGVQNNSFQPLVINSTPYTFTAPRYAPQSGQLQGVQVSIVNAEGWASSPLRTVLQAN